MPIRQHFVARLDSKIPWKSIVVKWYKIRKQNRSLVADYARMTINMALGLGLGQSSLTPRALRYSIFLLICVFSSFWNVYQSYHANKISQKENLIVGYLIFASKAQIKAFRLPAFGSKLRNLKAAPWSFVFLTQ